MDKYCQKWISPPARGLVFTITAAARANTGWTWYSPSLITPFQATGATTSDSSWLLDISTKRVSSVTGPRLTSADTTFTTADSARAKGFGDYGNCRASQAAFTSGNSATSKANKIRRARKNLRQWKQLARKSADWQSS